MKRSDAFEEPTDGADAIILEESRRVLDHQINIIKTVGERTAWTLRIGIVLLGVLISAARLLSVSNVNALGLVGVGFVLLSLLVGIVTYGVSDLDVGAEPGNLEGNVPEEYARSEVYDVLLAAHEDSIAFNRGTLRVNEWLLTLTQGLLVVGVSLVVAELLISV